MPTQFGAASRELGWPSAEGIGQSIDALSADHSECAGNCPFAPVCGTPQLRCDCAASAASAGLFLVGFES